MRKITKICDITLEMRAKLKYPTLTELRTKKWKMNEEDETFAIIQYNSSERGWIVTKKGEELLLGLIGQKFYSEEEMKRIITYYLDKNFITALKMIAKDEDVINYLRYNKKEIFEEFFERIKKSDKIEGFIEGKDK